MLTRAKSIGMFVKRKTTSSEIKIELSSNQISKQFPVETGQSQSFHSSKE